MALCEGLERLVEPPDGFTRDFVVETLETRGSIWAALHLPSVDPHVFVLTGLEANTLYYNDPWEPERKLIDFSDFQFAGAFRQQSRSSEHSPMFRPGICWGGLS
ncbi:papain-like cysteine protease family protein [Bradyrhizobium sp. ISRA442]|uniref:papain-like cysteine protease family protein n=1 Tax=Bradyrhizobium sp. ISRA442 TaxID=2866197 RepID=UPI00404B3F87